ncbi:MAG TPA: class I SAM-dependent methyltransferase [Methylocella sp.]
MVKILWAAALIDPAGCFHQRWSHDASARHTVGARRVNMKLHPQDLRKIAHLTLEHYNQRAEEFWNGTRDHNVSQNIEVLLQHIEGKPPFTILDFGCGPGRDLKVFAEQGHVAVGLEGAVHFAAMARARSGCDVWQQDFLKLELPEKCHPQILEGFAFLLDNLETVHGDEHF